MNSALQLNMHKFDLGHRKAIPGVLIALFSMLNVSVLPLLHHLPFTFGLAECAIFFWTLLRPALAPYWLLFLLGMITDAIHGGVFGLHAMTFMFMRISAASMAPLLRQRSVMVKLMGFALSYGAVCAVAYGMVSYFSAAPLNLAPVITGWLATVGIYPFISLLLRRVLFGMTGRRG